MLLKQIDSSCLTFDFTLVAISGIRSQSLGRVRLLVSVNTSFEPS